MMNKLFQVTEFARYIIHSRHWRGHGIHSPFMYDFIRNTLMKASKRDSAKRYIKELNTVAPKNILKSSFGATPESCIVSSKQHLNRISISPKYGKLINGIVNRYEPQRVLELGSGFGVSSYYLANGNPKSQVVTVEGMKEYAEIAEQTFQNLGISNVTVVNSTFNDFFRNVDTSHKFDLIFIDGNHSYESTIVYFNQSTNIASPEACIILDDIRWSKEMYDAWNELKHHKLSRVSVDLGRIGLIFFNPILQKQEYQVRY